jgi:hypothetical protein
MAAPWQAPWREARATVARKRDGFGDVYRQERYLPLTCLERAKTFSLIPAPGVLTPVMLALKTDVSAVSR